MPPSPTRRISPRRELRAENHKRGRSLESGILFQEKDDCLALFNEVQNKERQNFLLHSNDDFDNIFFFSVCADRCRYLLFMALAATKFRYFSDNKLGISIPGRGECSDLLNAEGNKNDYDWDGQGLQKCSKQRPSPSPIKPTSPSRTSTPNPRRMSPGSACPNGLEGKMPLSHQASRGNSTSPKISAWQSNIPGFSSEALPNLRTSLADRPASYVRGSSPASRNGFRSGRQSMSPTASRSVSSSHSHDRDQCSSFSKGSVASSGDDDVDSLQLNPVRVDLSVARGFGALLHNRAMGFSKKGDKVLRSSAPKRSFELALRQMPTSSRIDIQNSSITTSSNASSDQGTSGGALDTEESEQNPEDVTSGFVKGQYPTTHDKIFVMDQADALNESTENKIIEESPSSPRADNDEPSTVVSQLDDRESNADFTQDMEFCSKCENTTGESIQILEDCGSLNVLDPSPSIQESSQVTWLGETVTDIISPVEMNPSVDPSCVCWSAVVDVSEGTGHVFPGVTPSCLGDSLEVPAVDKDKETENVTCLDPHEDSLTSECTDVESTCTDIESSIIFKTAAELSEEPASHENGDSLTNISSNSIIEEISAEISTQGDYFMQSSCTDRVDVAEVPQTSSLNAIWEIKIENDDIVSAKSHSDVDSTTSKSRMNELMEYSVSLAGNDVVTTAVQEIDTSLPSNGVLEESTIVLEDLGGRKLRSLTLKEATDAILFCSSIVHNLAYEAADIALSKDNSPVEVLRPAVTFVGKSSSDRRDIIRSRTMARRSSKSQKARQRKLETDTKPPPVVNEINEKHTECNVRSPGKGGSMNPLKLESKCNCMII
ncbi:hypothetical protein OROHE_003495 [Orobanche hederae]